MSLIVLWANLSIFKHGSVLFFKDVFTPGHLARLADNSVPSHQGWCHLKIKTFKDMSFLLYHPTMSAYYRITLNVQRKYFGNLER